MRVPCSPAEFRERIFETLFRVEHHRRGDAKERKGTGIGLYSSKPRITAHSGPMWCDLGAHGVGTRLALTLPGEG